MRRGTVMLLAGVVLISACSKREERSASEEAEWNKIQPLDQVKSDSDVSTNVVVKAVVQSKSEDYISLIARMKQMNSIKREKGEALLTGEGLIFNYKRRVVRMDGDVKVVDDRGILRAESLTGRFTEKNEVEIIEARRNVRITSEGRIARAQRAEYMIATGAVELEGQASVSDQTHEMKGERIFFWMKGGTRRIVCEPNAYLMMKGTSGLGQSQQVSSKTNSTPRVTEVWANRVVFDESKNLVEMEGNVRLRDKQAALNCGMVRIFLLGTNQIDRIEARVDVNAWSGLRKMRSDQAVYQSATQDLVLTGNVRVSNEQATMDCETVHVYLKGTNEIDWIEARTDVIIQSGERRALAGKASYYADEGKVVLDEDPKMKQGKNIMMGDRITFWPDNRRMVCEPNARLLLYPDEKTKLKFMKDLKK